MDTIYRGIAESTRTFALGAPDMDPDARPGAILARMVGDALLSGAFTARRDAPRAGVASPAANWAPAYVERMDYGAFDDDGPEAGLPGH